MILYATIRRMGRGLLVALAVLAVVVAGYAGAGMIGGAIPANAGWRPPTRGVPVYLESNGVHVSLVLPKVAAGIDWRDWAPGADLADPRYARYDHIAIGWGERTFFLDTPTWADVRLATILHAAIGSDATLLHVEYVPAPAPGDGIRVVTLRPEEYRRLATGIRASAAPVRRTFRGYGANDVFYAGTGHYSARHTCNAWVGATLANAGVRVGRWTPFPITVLSWF